MYFNLRDVVTFDVVLEHLHSSTIADHESPDARRLRAMREHLPIEGDVLDEMLVMQMQEILTPLLLDGNSADLPEMMTARIKELIASLDIGRSRM